MFTEKLKWLLIAIGMHGEVTGRFARRVGLSSLWLVPEESWKALDINARPTHAKVLRRRRGRQDAGTPGT
jgi:hypothetical protein